MLCNSLRRIAPFKAALRANFASSASAAQEGANSSYNSFRTAYIAQQQKLREKLNESGSAAAHQKRPAGQRKVYRHPFHDSVYNPISMSHIEVLRDAQEFLGPEIVSPHYENFFHSRRWGLSFLAGFGLLQLVANSRDIQHFAVSATAPYLFWTFTFYFFLEAKSSLLKPLLFKFHNEIIDHETSLLMADWNDSMREFLQTRMDDAKEQLEYFNVHQDYYSIKSESINRFLAIEQLNLQNHIQTRALKVLQSAEQMEQANQRYLVNNIVNEALAEVDRTLSENLEALQDPMFESALIGLKQRKMTYEKDPLLPMIRDRIQSKISKLNNMTEEEYVLAYCRRDKLVQLSNDQLEMLRTLDRQLRDEFLRKIPKLDQSIKQYPHVKHTLDNWGKDFQEKAHA